MFKFVNFIHLNLTIENVRYRFFKSRLFFHSTAADFLSLRGLIVSAAFPSCSGNVERSLEEVLNYLAVQRSIAFTTRQKTAVAYETYQVLVLVLVREHIADMSVRVRAHSYRST